MPSPTAVIGATAVIYVPNDDEIIDLGYTGIRIYWATSETATASLATTLTLVEGQKDYSYNKTDALSTDWFEYAFFGSTPGEGPRSERVPVGPPQNTRQDIRLGVGERLEILTEGTVLASPAPTSTAFASTNLIDADASESKFANHFCRFNIGDLDGEIRRVRNTTNSGYAPATGVITCNAFSEAPGTGDTFELWIPHKDRDPSAAIDAAMNWVAHRIWWEATYYFSIDSGVTEYAVPALMQEGAVRSVDWASDTYPNRPGWQNVAHWSIYTQGGNRYISFGAPGNPLPGEYAAGDVIRILYARPGDAMDSDADYWSVPLEWAVAETAMAYLSRIATPRGGKENVSDAERAMGALQADLRLLREIYMPAAYAHEEPPR